MSEIISVPLNKLVRSERNVRKTGGESIDELAASILAHGLLHNLSVIQQRSGKGASSGKYEVIAGGRRYALSNDSRRRRSCQRPSPCHA